MCIEDRECFIRDRGPGSALSPFRGGGRLLAACEGGPTPERGGVLSGGYNEATRFSPNAPGIDWRDRRHWQCNNNVHPSRAGTYDGVSMHPFETLFVKSSWHVADVYTRRYAAWTLGHMLGRPGTDGVTDRRLYLYAISERAQHPKDLESAYRPVLE